MRSTKRFLSLLLALLLIISMTACTQTPAETTLPPETTAPVQTTAPTETTAPLETTVPEETTEPTEPMTEEEKILWDRRVLAESYMRYMRSILWRADEDIVYTVASNTNPEDAAESAKLQIIAGRLYQGIPYAFTYCTGNTFLDYAIEQDSNGIYTISGLKWEALSGTGNYARVGNDCSGACVTSWSLFGASITGVVSSQMGTDYGFIPVGDYIALPNYDDTNFTATVIAHNSKEVMYASYAQLQKADILMRRSQSSNHAMMVVDVNVVYKENGEIDDRNSTVTILEQGRTNQQGQNHYTHETLGEEVYYIGSIDRVYTFKLLREFGYIPITCKELIDPSPVAPPEITDSVTEFNKDTLLTGTISCNWFIDTITVTITDSQSTEIQKATNTPRRQSPRVFNMEQFVTDNPNAILGSVDPSALASGNYHCTVTCRLTTGEEFTVRDFDFTV